jgi:hypothetical protein
VAGGSPAKSAAASWAVVAAPNPSSTSNRLEDISCTSNSECTAVGSYSGSSLLIPMALRWNGVNWSTQSISLTESAQLNGVSCVSSSECFAVGWVNKPPKPLAEMWNGKEWKKQTLPLPSGATVGQLEAISCLTATSCFAVGYYEAGAGPRTYAVQWTGAEWVLRTPLNSSSATNILKGVSCQKYCFAVGYYLESLGGSYPLIERWNGSEWTIQSSPSVEGASNHTLYDVSCTSIEACTAVGSYGNGAGTLQKTLAERWNGKSWSIQGSPNPPESKNAEFFDVSCVSATNCEAVGYNVTNSGTTVTLAEAWAEGIWSVQSTPNPLTSTSTVFRGVSCLTALSCFGVGNYSKPELNSANLIERYS